MANTAIISDIQRASFHDGPGIRTTVFFKGCPLNCAWCHNPECIKKQPQTMYYPEKCIGCGECDGGCYSGARVVCGKEMSTDDVLREVLLDKEHYKSNGGVTFSGGEPMLYPDFVLELAKKCRENSIGTAIETSMIYFRPDIFEYIDYIMCDIKIFNSEIHKKYVGVENGTILENIKRADALGKPILVRTPIIPGVNDTPENIRDTAEFVSHLKNAVGYELLPYHPLGEAKRKALGLESSRFDIPSKEKMKELKRYAYIQ